MPHRGAILVTGGRGRAAGAQRPAVQVRSAEGCGWAPSRAWAQTGGRAALTGARDARDGGMSVVMVVVAAVLGVAAVLVAVVPPARATVRAGVADREAPGRA